MTLTRYDVEDLNGFTSSRGFTLFLTQQCEQIATWSRELIRNRALTEGQRLGYQIAIQAVQEGIQIIFEKAHAQMPDWLKKELMLDE